MTLSALQKTFAYLAKSSSAAAVPVLEQAMRCVVPSIRLEATRTLLQRGTPEDMEAIIRSLDHFTRDELSFLGTCKGLLELPIAFATRSSNIELRQAGLVAAARLQLTTQLHQIVNVAENPDDELQIAAIELLTDLATVAGSIARSEKKRPTSGLEKSESSRHSPSDRENEDFRSQLTSLLKSAVSQFDHHKVSAILDCWLLASHWEDPGYQSLFSPFPDPVAPHLIRRLRQLRNPEIASLVTGAYWSRSASSRCLEIVLQRPPEQILLAFLKLERFFGIDQVVADNLTEIPVPALSDVQDSQFKKLADEELCSWLDLQTKLSAPADTILKGFCHMACRFESVENWPAKAEASCIQAIRSLPPLEPSIASLVLSEGLNKASDLTPYEPPPWKSSLKHSILKAVELFSQPATLPNSVQLAIRHLFQNFNVSTLLSVVESWPTDHIIAFANLTSTFDHQYQSALAAEIHNPAPARRKCVFLLLQLLDPADWITEIAYQGLEEANWEIRIEAMTALARSTDQMVVQQCLTPLLNDSSTDVAEMAQMLLNRAGV